MHSLLPWFVAASLLGLLAARRRRMGELAQALVVVGLAAVALLWPTWAVPDGIPSPAANLERMAPWQAAPGQTAASAASGGANPELIDVTFQIEPWLLYLRSELRAGRLPLWNPHQSSGAPFWSNGQSAVLFPLHLLFAAVPVALGFVLLPWLRVVIGGLGTWRLARTLGIGQTGALLAAVVYPLCGRLVGFLLFPMANSLALVPWVLWAVERLTSGGTATGASVLAVVTALQLLGGHPETAVFTGVVTALYLLVRGTAAPVHTWSRFALGWLGGLAVAAVQLVPLAWTLLATDRWQSWHAGDPPSWLERGQVLARLLFPGAFGSALDGSWWGPFLWMPTGLYVGLLTLPLAFAGAAGWRRDRRVAGLLALVAFGFAAALALPGLRQLLLALPVVQKGLHHYFVFAALLGLALLAGRGLERWRVEGARAVGPGVVVTIVAGLLVAGLLVDSWRARGQLAGQGLAAIWVCGGPLLLLAAGRLRAAGRARLAFVVVAASGIDLALAHGPINPGVSRQRLYPPTGATRFLAGRPERLAAVDDVLRPNAAMVYGLYDVRGDDSLKLASYERIYGSELGAPHPSFYRPLRHWQSPWLDRLGVRWVLTSPGAAAPVPAWTLAYDGPDARVWDRGGGAEGAGSMVRGAGCAELRGERRGPGDWEVHWRSIPGVGCAIEIAEVADPGWRGEVDGQTVVIDRGDRGDRGESPLLRVAVGPGAGTLRLAYVPQGWMAGLATSLGAVAMLASSALWRRRHLLARAVRGGAAARRPTLAGGR